MLNENENILNFVKRNGKKLEYEDFILAIQTIKANSTVYFMGFGSYKPVYFLCNGNK